MYCLGNKLSNKCKNKWEVTNVGSKSDGEKCLLQMGIITRNKLVPKFNQRRKMYNND